MKRNRVAASCQRSPKVHRAAIPWWEFVVEYTSVERGRARDGETQKERERMRQWDPTRRMSRTFSRCSDKVCNGDATGMSRRANNASACRLAASARFFLDPRARTKLPASSVRCQEIYLRRRHHVFGCPRPAANNSLIYLLFAFKDRLTSPRCILFILFIIILLFYSCII